MTDIVVGIVRDYLVEQIKHEAQVLSELEGKVDLIRKELERINAFLKDSQGKRDNEKVKVVIKQIREAAYRIEDVIDNYIVSVITQKNRGLIGQVAHLIDYTKTLNNVNDDIDQIKKDIAAIYSDIQQFNIKPTEPGRSIDESAVAASARIAELVQRRRSNVEEDEVVGFDKYSEEVVKLLVEGNSSRDVVSIVGMAGLGKTTLARKVYRDPLISSKKHFDHCAWHVVGEKYNVKEILLGIWRSLESVPDHVVKQNKRNTSESESVNKISEVQEIAMVKREIREYLRDTSYLIVLDDVWSKNIWDEIQDAFPDDGMGSRVLITSRQEKEASAISKTISNTSPYQLQRLSDHHSWELFSKKVFWKEDSRPGLKALGEKIVRDCKGLPLSIVVIAGILRNKERSEREWEQVAGHVNWYINNEDILVREIVRLSYDDLPLYLKPCFLYFGIYPEDFEIPVRQLIQLWIAEGFIHETGPRTPEEVAEYYLEELIRRSLIQVERRRTDGGVKTCRIHDLLRDICVTECKENHILEVRKDVSNNEGQPRRLSLHCSAPYYMSATSCDHSITRSLFCFDKDAYLTDSGYVDMICKKFKLLRVLDAGQVDDHFCGFLRGLHDIIHLRYFRVSGGGRNYSGNSIHKLLYLETLDMRGTQIIDAPKEMWKLKQLRHLYISGREVSLPNIPGKKSLPNLQTLSTIRLDEQTVKQLKKIPNLRKLGVDCLRSKSSNPMELLAKIRRLHHLTTLKVLFCNGKLASVSEFPPNITKITLIGSYDGWSGILKSLGSLPKLRYLKISGYDSEKFNEFKLESDDIGCFPQLLLLKMKGLKCDSWKMTQGSMPQLQCLVINHCEFPTDLPSAQSFTALQELQLLWSSKEVVDKFQNLGLKDSCKLTIFPAIGGEEDDEEEEDDD